MHQKRISAPRSWPIAKKASKWVVASSPGAHSKQAVPMLIVLRDILGLADNAKEVKRILHKGDAKVNGRVIKDHKAHVGLFDVLSIAGTNYRMLPNPRGKFELIQISDDEAKSKLARIDDITVLKGSRLQYNLHDGSNLLLQEKYNTGDSLVLSLPDHHLIERYERKPGSTAMIVAGKHSGETGIIKELKETTGSRPNMVTIERDDTQFETIADYVFVTGSSGV
ncbi:MAG: 30S ribosomal protein S4e [Halobacteriota archaeon]